MKATVTYDSDGKPNTIRLAPDGRPVMKLKMIGSTAVVTSLEPVKGETAVYTSELTEMLDYVEQLGFVQAVTMEGDE